MHWGTGFETSISGGPRADSAQLVTLRQNWDRAPKDGNEYVRDYPQKKQQYSGFASVVGWSASLTLPDYGRFARYSPGKEHDSLLCKTASLNANVRRGRIGPSWHVLQPVRIYPA